MGVVFDVLVVTNALFQREARNHFNCPTLNGMELENLGGPGTQFGHWKARLVEVCYIIHLYTVDRYRKVYSCTQVYFI